MQIDKLVALQKEGVVSLQKLGDTGVWYQKNFPMSAATAQVVEQDWRGTGQKTVWYNCKNYRANLHFSEGKLWLRDLTKFDDRYQERYLHKSCEGWIATYDNLPIVDSRIWSSNDKVCELSFIKKVTEIEVRENGDTGLLLKVAFEEGTEGKVILSEDGIVFENCGELSYSWGAPTEYTALVFEDNCLKGSQNGFTYEMPVDGHVIKRDDSFLLQPKDGKLSFKLDKKV